jgi:hypothetical protein
VDGTTELVHRVLRAPEHGAGYFFPSTASGTPIWVADLAFSLGLYSVVNAEWINTTAIGIVLPVAFAVGAVAMTVGALWDFRAHDPLGGVAGMAYATFWLSFALLERFFRAGIENATGAAGYADAFGVYLVMWSLLTLILAGAALRYRRGGGGKTRGHKRPRFAPLGLSCKTEARCSAQTRFLPTSPIVTAAEGWPWGVPTSTSSTSSRNQ